MKRITHLFSLLCILLLQSYSIFFAFAQDSLPILLEVDNEKSLDDTLITIPQIDENNFNNNTETEAEVEIEIQYVDIYEEDDILDNDEKNIFENEEKNIFENEEKNIFENEQEDIYELEDQDNDELLDVSGIGNDVFFDEDGIQEEPTQINPNTNLDKSASSRKPQINVILYDTDQGDKVSLDGDSDDQEQIEKITLYETHEGEEIQVDVKKKKPVDEILDDELLQDLDDYVVNSTFSGTRQNNKAPLPKSISGGLGVNLDDYNEDEIGGEDSGSSNLQLSQNEELSQHQNNYLQDNELDTKNTKDISDVKKSKTLLIENEYIVEADEAGTTIGRSLNTRSSLLKKKARTKIKANTTIRSAHKGTVGFEDLTMKELDEQPELFGFSMVGGVSIGPDDDHLIFSQPIQIDIPIDSSFNNQEVAVYVFHLGDDKFNTGGLTNNPNATCRSDGFVQDEEEFSNIVTVVDEIATIYTCGASIFTVTYTGGANIDNFVDNSSSDKTITVTSGDVAPGSTISNILVIIDFHSIDGIDPVSPGIDLSHSDEISFSLTSPSATIVNLLDQNTYTNPNAPRVTVTFDDTAGSLPSGVPSAGTFLPVGNLSDFVGEDPIGDWTFTFADSTADDGLILFSVSLEINTDELCGNGVLNPGEQCDDSNLVNSDGCNQLCNVEAGYTCSGTPSSCSLIPAPTGLTLHYNGSQGGGLFTDISGNGYDGTIFNGVTTSSVNGETVMCFNGTNQYIERATNLATSYPFTMSSWIKSNNIGGITGIMSFARSSSTNRMYNLETNGTSIIANAQNPSSRLATATTTLNTTQRFLVTAVFTSDTSRDIYVNGVYEASNTLNASYDTNTTKRLNIGRFADSSPSDYFNGCIDDVRFYTTALTAGQIYDLYAKPAALTTYYTIDASPVLTGTIQGVLDTISLTISGNVYTGTNNGNGTRTLPASTISPDLINGTYPTILTVTNPYGRSVTYNSSFIVDIPVPACGDGNVDPGEQCDDNNTINGDGCSNICQIEITGDVTISGPSSLNFSGVISSQNYTQLIEQQFTGFFQVDDSLGSDTGYYTTLQIGLFSGSNYGNFLSYENIERYATGITLLSGDANTDVVLPSGWSTYSVASGSVTFIKRDLGVNAGRIGIYGTLPFIRITIPPYTVPDTYQGILCYTLYKD